MSISGRSCTIFCSDINPNTILFLLAAFTLYMAFLLTYNWPVLYCVKIMVPYIIVFFLYLVGGFILLFGIIFSVRALITAFPWIMFLSLIGSIVYDIMLCVDQKCICERVYYYYSGKSFQFIVAYEYFSLGFLAGLNYVAALYAMLLVMDYIKDSSPEN